MEEYRQMNAEDNQKRLCGFGHGVPQGMARHGVQVGQGR